MTRAATLVACVLAAATPTLAQPAPPPAQHGAPAPAHPDAAALASRTIEFLRSRQDPASGGWNVAPGRPVFPAITALVVQGMLANGVDPADPAVARGVAFLLSRQQPDGGIYDSILPSYNTAISLAALARIPAPDAKLKDAIARAQTFLKGLQYGEGAVTRDGAVDAAEAVDRSHPYYGGWGYGNHGRPDMSNTSFAVEALRVSGLPETDPAFRRALVFLQRCQMQHTAPDGTVINDSPFAAGSTQGGFIYATSINKDQVGSGQTNAGEITESLSGPPGLAARVRLTKKEGDKPVTLTRDEVRARVSKAIADANTPALRTIGETCVITFNQGFTGAGGSDFEIRCGLTDEKLFGSLVAQAFTDLSDAPVEVRKVAHWQGESRLRAYGSMTYSGFKSYLYAGLTPTDPRVIAAKDWIRRNYTLDENPGVGTDGLYYYLLVFARALGATGDDVVMTLPAQDVPTARPADGRTPGSPATPDSSASPGNSAASGQAAPRRWRDDLVARLATLAQPDGSMTPVDDRWMENDPVLISAYALNALGEARK
ncbi:MAG: prenyltransferase/squalene oxidase repeat-containing protein [Planctomycetota bacterium]|nr:prenyltransferase/squalene oxidase repeat-containing protein [Planctomycetota bacterium]